LDVVAKIEHERLVPARLTAGWTVRPKDTTARTAAFPIPWEALDESDREKNREAIHYQIERRIHQR